MTRHALRTLVKRDYPPALELLGYLTQSVATLSLLQWSSKVQVGESFECSFHLRSEACEKLFVALRIHFLKTNDTLAPKVFLNQRRGV